MTDTALNKMTGIPDTPWPEFLSRFYWEQGEHISMIGPTGGGKTTLALQLLPKRMYVAAFVTKPKDRTFNGMQRDGYRKMDKWAPTIHTKKILLWPKFNKPEDVENQEKVFHDALEEIFTQGNWTVYIDELRYMCDYLHQKKLVELFWQQGRALKISVVGIAQRPAWVPQSMYDQATHLFFWRDGNDTNLKRLGEMTGINSQLVKRTVSALATYQVLYVNSRTGEMTTTKVKV